jgi:hypothetical protein
MALPAADWGRAERMLVGVALLTAASGAARAAAVDGRGGSRCAPGVAEAARVAGRDLARDIPACAGEGVAAEAETRAPLVTPADWAVIGTQASANFGWSVASAGDVNGDGWDDVIVGAQLEDVPPLTGAGRAYVFHGSAAGLSTTPNWITAGERDFSNYGLPVASAGDVNNDGYDDVIVGAWLDGLGLGNEGLAYLYLGSGAGLSTTPAWVGRGNQVSAYFGWAVASAGDVNGDDYDDVIVGAYGHDGVGSASGRAYVYHGSASGLATTPAWIGEGAHSLAIYGHDVASAGDVNNDGFDDVIVGSYRYTGSLTEQGRAYVYLGSATGLSTSAAWTADGAQVNAWFGAKVASAGDVNGDGFDELLVAAEREAAVGTTRGVVRLFSGSAGGPAASPAWTARNDGTWGRFGSSVASAGDFNRDGIGDVIVGAADFNGGPVGGFLTYFGSPVGLSPAATWTERQDRGVGVSVASAGDVNGDGAGDVVIGAPFGAEPKGRALVYHGFRVVKGDLDRDFSTDLLLRNGTTGALDLWVMDGVQRTQLLAVTPTPALDQQVVGVDDFDDDRGNDLVLWNQVSGQVEFWRMQGATRVGAPVLLGGAPPLSLDWRVAATADFDRDRRPDILWANSATGQMVVWTIVDMARTGTLVPTPSAPGHLNWKVVAARDWNGDWMPDLLFYNETSGRTVQWLLDPSLVRVSSRFTNPMGPDSNAWRAAAAGDYGIGPGGVVNSNDIVWRNAQSGRLVVWYMDYVGNRTAGAFTDPPEPAPDPLAWTVTGPR